MTGEAAAPPRRLVLIDGSSYLYRAFHALPPLTTSKGQPTGAIYGFLNMLQKLRTEQQPDLIAVVMDAPGPTFRDELYADYKAHREAMPDELRAQVEPLMAVVQALGLPLLREPGVEADDVIGTLAVQAAAAGLDTVIATSDKDMAQLVTDRIRLVDTLSGRVLDPAGVVGKFGVPPERIVDYLALVGDTSDNIPGVPGVGPKTAAKWLGQYGTLDAIVASADAIAGKVGEKLQASLDQLPLSRRLATIHTAVPLRVAPLDLVPKPVDAEAVRRLSAELEIRSLLQRIPSEDAAGEMAGSTPSLVPGTGPTRRPAVATAPAADLDARLPDPVVRHYRLILTQPDFEDWCARIEATPLVAFDTETTSLDYMAAEVVGLSFAVAPGEAAYVPVAHTYMGAPDQLSREAVLARLRPWLEDDARPKVGHHLKYDAHVLLNHGIRLAGMRYDSMLESYVLHSTATRHDLDSVARKYLGLTTIHYEDVAGKGASQIPFEQVSVEKAAEYSAEDADVSLRLHEALWPQIEATPGLREVYESLEQPLVPVLLRMERTGVLVDVALLRQLSSEFAHKMAAIEQDAHAAAGHPFNLTSPKQLAEVLYNELKLPVTAYTPTKQPSTNEDALEELASLHPLPRLVLDYRSVSKLKSTYTDKLPELVAKDGRIHTSYHQAVAATGRLSSSDPNLQNIPIRTEEGRRIRQAFIAPEGCVLLAADYSQIELRIMAHISGDEGLLRAFAEDLDVHQATAAEVFGVPLTKVTADQRRSAKAINFGLIYGMSAFGLARQLGIGRDEAQRYVDLYFDRYPGVKAYMDRTRTEARERGYVETVFGRRLYLPDINARQQSRRQYAERSAINAPMQGTAADIVKRAMIDVDHWLAGDGRDTGARILMQVHDELVLEVPVDSLARVKDRVVTLMAGAAQLKVPLKVDAGTGANWDEAH
jgi:DNA polymerase-1